MSRILSDAFAICPPSGPDADCWKFEHLRFDKEHRIEDYTVNGIPLAQLNFPAATNPTEDGIILYRFLGGVQSPQGDSYGFTVEIRNNSQSVLDIDPLAGFRDQENVEHAVRPAGRLHLERGQATQIYVDVDSLHGGWLHIDVHPTNTAPQTHWIEIP